jgi:hypothetical protein
LKYFFAALQGQIPFGQVDKEKRSPELILATFLKDGSPYWTLFATFYTPPTIDMKLTF